MRTAPRGGTVLMEAVLCLPLLLFLVTGVVQFARIWEAKLLTRHAAYNAARAALVYNYDEYTTDTNGKRTFCRDYGPVWLAAVNTLVWKSATTSLFGPMDDYLFPGFSDDSGNPPLSYRVPNSAFIQDQVRIDHTQSLESNGVVRVTVQFRFPLLFSIFALGTVQGQRDDDLYGDTTDVVPLVHDETDNPGLLFWHDSVPHIRLSETRSLPKPWCTKHYPRVSAAEAAYMEMNP